MTFSQWWDTDEGQAMMDRLMVGIYTILGVSVVGFVYAVGVRVGSGL
jgi:hypothetical protein